MKIMMNIIIPINPERGSVKESESKITIPNEEAIGTLHHKKIIW